MDCDSTVNICCLDIAKSFDPLNHITVKYCQHYTDFLLIKQMVRLRKVKFITSLKNDSNNYLMQILHNFFAKDELRFIADVYNVIVENLYTENCRSIISCHIAMKLDLWWHFIWQQLLRCLDSWSAIGIFTLISALSFLYLTVVYIICCLYCLKGE